MNFILKIIRKIKIKKLKRKLLLEKNVELGSRVKLENTLLLGNNKIGSDCSLNNSILGFASYCGKNCHLENTKIGNYTSIASNVDIINGNHPTRKFVTTHPFAYSNSLKNIGFNFNKNLNFISNNVIENNFTAISGNDVWIGENVKILNGVTIGNGAIIGTGAVVVKNVSPYSIVGGVPAKLIRYRFKEEDIKFLEEFKWWDKDINWIKKHSKLFSEIELFKKIKDD